MNEVITTLKMSGASQKHVIIATKETMKLH